MSKTEALEMTSSRSRLSSSDVQAFALFIFFASFLRGHARFRALDAAGLSLFASVLPACLPLMSSNISFCPAAACGFLPTMVQPRGRLRVISPSLAQPRALAAQP
jgi:hypothetical protein